MVGYGVLGREMVHAREEEGVNKGKMPTRVSERREARAHSRKRRGENEE
uniref:Uncharacterized protein n=1 Tax=Picea sitchensis TaxID=3332 RepID=A9NWI0_PICSI|nr:unknown [Picea sitchensis]